MIALRAILCMTGVCLCGHFLRTSAAVDVVVALDGACGEGKVCNAGSGLECVLVGDSCTEGRCLCELSRVLSGGTCATGVAIGASCGQSLCSAANSECTESTCACIAGFIQLPEVNFCIPNTGALDAVCDAGGGDKCFFVRGLYYESYSCVEEFAGTCKCPAGMKRHGDTCIPSVIGDQCSADTDCYSGMVCDVTIERPTCKCDKTQLSQYQCDAARETATASLGATCENDAACPTGLSCMECPDSPGSSKCVRPAGRLGTACSVNHDCTDPNSVCDVDGTSECMCIPGFMQYGGTASVGGMCVEALTGEPGYTDCAVLADCTAVTANSECSLLNVCECTGSSVGDNMLCRIPGHLDSVCADNAACATTLNSECSQSTSRCKCLELAERIDDDDSCRLPGELGTSCESNEDCNSVTQHSECSVSEKCVCIETATASGGKCIIPGDLGTECAADTDCSSVTVNSKCSATNECECVTEAVIVDGRCIMPGNVGGTCTTTVDCEGNVANSECNGEKICECVALATHYLDMCKLPGGSQIGGPCTTTADCAVTHTVCSDIKRCMCKDGYIPSSITECKSAGGMHTLSGLLFLTGILLAVYCI